MRIAAHLKQPTRMINPGKRAGLAPCVIPIRSCSRWGLPCRFRCRSRGGLLPHPFTLTPPPHLRLLPGAGPAIRWRGGLLSVALSLGSPPPDVIRHRLSVEPGLSSPCCLSTLQGAAARPTGALSLDHRARMARTIAAVRAPDDTSTGSTIDKSRTAAYRARRVKAPAARWLVHGEVLRIKVSSTDFS
jgi:hypothetical protein